MTRIQWHRIVVAKLCLDTVKTYEQLGESANWTLAEYVVKLGHCIGATKDEVDTALNMRLIDIAQPDHAMADQPIEIILDRATGTVQFIHSDAAMRLARTVAGTPVIRRASHVEPVPGTAQWTADMAPVGGPVLGPFDTHQEALDQEVIWLKEHHLYRQDATTPCTDGDRKPGSMIMHNQGTSC
jgi:hypothetical protein